MVSSNRSDQLYRSTGVITWLTITGLLLWALPNSRPEVASAWPLALALALTFFAGCVLAGGSDDGYWSRRLGQTGLWVALAAALTLGWVFPIGFLPIYTIIWIAFAPIYYGNRTCFVLLLGVMLAWAAVFELSWETNDSVTSILAYATFHLFAWLSSRNEHLAQQQKARAEQLNRELAATQHLLSEASRQSERTRIARDLHDLVGHHLTALTINLQIAERLSSGEARERIEQSHALARLLLADVREAVSTLRENSTVDFHAALSLMVERLPRLDVTLDIDPAVAIDDVAVAEPLLRCVQEALTNTLKHSNARRSTVRLAREADRIVLSIVDDGGTTRAGAAGNGLTGMRERIEHLRGTLRIDAQPDSFGVFVELPDAA